MSAPSTQSPALRPLDLAAALVTGGLLSFMVMLNGLMSSYTTPFFSSLAAHGTGTVAAAIAMAIIWRKRPNRTGKRAPLWAYAGGLSGAVTVMLTSTTVNSPLALTGTLALGLAGQVVLGLVCDKFGLLGMAKRQPTGRDLAALACVLAGALMIIFAGGNG